MQTIGNLSSDEASRATQRGEAVQANPALGDDLAAGELSVGHANVIADTSAKTDGAAATDDRFLERVRAANPDQAAKIGAGYVEDHNEQISEEKAGSEYQRQYRARTAKRFGTRSGTKILQLEGPASTIDQLWSTLMGDADRLYRSDGGRDVPDQEHSRTREQRLFDAALERLTNTSAPNRSSRSRSTVVATLDLNTLLHQLDGSAALGAGFGVHADYDTVRAMLIGTGQIPAAVREYLMCTSDWVGLIFGQDGEVLWQGRNVRTATRAQQIALTVRDQGCVLCHAHPDRCQIHHLNPWNAPAKGRTDIDDLALLCGDCHRRVHDTKQTLYHDPALGTWRLRAATANETPPNWHSDTPHQQTRPQQETSAPAAQRQPNGSTTTTTRAAKPKARLGNCHSGSRNDPDPD